jgi:hypothetical protein
MLHIAAVNKVSDDEPAAIDRHRESSLAACGSCAGRVERDECALRTGGWNVRSQNTARQEGGKDKDRDVNLRIAFTREHGTASRKDEAIREGGTAKVKEL